MQNLQLWFHSLISLSLHSDYGTIGRKILFFKNLKKGKRIKFRWLKCLLNLFSKYLGHLNQQVAFIGGLQKRKMIRMDNLIADLANFAKSVNSEEKEQKMIGEVFIDLVKQYDNIDELDELGYCKIDKLITICCMKVSHQLSMTKADNMKEKILNVVSIEEVHQVAEGLVYIPESWFPTEEDYQWFFIEEE